MGHSCATNSDLQICFHLVPLARILRHPLPQPAVFLTSVLNSYTTGNGPLDIQDLIPIPATISSPEDAGEILSHFFNQMRAAQPEHKLPMPTTLSLSPADTLHRFGEQHDHRKGTRVPFRPLSLTRLLLPDQRLATSTRHVHFTVPVRLVAVFKLPKSLHAAASVRPNNIYNNIYIYDT
jgi:hypothetical protein